MQTLRAGILALLIAGTSFGQWALLPTPRVPFIDANGLPLVGGKVYTYVAGTTTPLATYTDSTGATPNANPIILDAAGRASIWISNNSYKIVAQNAAGVTQWTADNVSDLAMILRSDLASALTGKGATLVGYQPPTGAATTVSAQLTALINSAKSLKSSCVGDGVADDTACVQTAINAAVAAHGAVNCSGGTWKTTTVLTVNEQNGAGDTRQAFTLVGDGTCKFLVSSSDGTGGIDIIPHPVASVGYGGDYTTLVGIRMERDPNATGKPAFGIRCNECTYFDFDHIQVNSVSGTSTNQFLIGLDLNGSQQGSVINSGFMYNSTGVQDELSACLGCSGIGGQNYFTGNTLFANTVDGYRGGGIWMSGGQYDSSQNAVHLTGHFPNTIAGINHVHFEGNTGNDVLLETGSYTMISNADFESGTTANSVHAKSGATVRMKDNFITSPVVFDTGSCPPQFVSLPIPPCSVEGSTYTVTATLTDNSANNVSYAHNSPNGNNLWTKPTLETVPLNIVSRNPSATAITPLIKLNANPLVGQDVYQQIAPSGSMLAGLFLGPDQGGPGIVSDGYFYLTLSGGVGSGSGAIGTPWLKLSNVMATEYTVTQNNSGFLYLSNPLGVNYLGFNYSQNAAALVNSSQAGYQFGQNVDGTNRFVLQRFPVGGAMQTSFAVESHGFIQDYQTIFGALTTPDNGNSARVYCTDCTVGASAPWTCTGGGTGAFAFFNKGAQIWKCPF